MNERGLKKRIEKGEEMLRLFQATESLFYDEMICRRASYY